MNFQTYIYISRFSLLLYIKVLSNSTEFTNDISLITINGRHDVIFSEYMQVAGSLEKITFIYL